MKPRALLCGCLLTARLEEIPRLLMHPEVDLVEWRLDAFLRDHSGDLLRDALPSLAFTQRRPVIVTNRPQREGGFFTGSEQARLDWLVKAVAHGADWVDLENDTPAEVLHHLQGQKAGVLLSHHDFAGTPDSLSLRRLLEKMARKGAQTVKIATTAREPCDNLRVLELVHFGRHELQLQVIAFCMGAAGRWSRIACVLLGSPWTYVQLPGQVSAAPGQLTAAEARRAMELFS